MDRYAMLVSFFSVAPVLSQVVSYQANSFPENEGWIRIQQPFMADRWLEGGWLVQNPEIVDPGPPVLGEDDFYRYELAPASMQGFPSWFLEWVMVTDGPEAFSANAPSGIVAGGTSGVYYHFTIAATRVRFLRGSEFPIVFADFDPGPHVFRLELRGSASYAFTIDGKLVDAGVPEAVYPTEDSVIVFGARAAIEDSITRWDYIKFGFLATGDMDEDGDIDVADFEMFQSCVAEAGPGAPTDPDCWGADMDHDGDADFHDFAPFQRAFTGPK